MIVFITTVFHTLGQIDQVRLVSIGPSHFKKVESANTFCGPAETIFGQKSGPAMAGSAGPPPTALKLNWRCIV